MDLGQILKSGNITSIRVGNNTALSEVVLTKQVIKGMATAQGNKIIDCNTAVNTKITQAEIETALTNAGIILNADEVGFFKNQNNRYFYVVYDMNANKYYFEKLSKAQ